MPTSIAGVLRLRAINPLLCDRSSRRFAQDDDFVGALKVTRSKRCVTRSTCEATLSPKRPRRQGSVRSIGFLMYMRRHG